MEFKEKKLGELCDIKGGKRLPKGKKLVDFNTGHPYIRITDMYQNKEINLNKGIMYVEEDTYKSISKYTVNSKNVIIAIVGSTIGLVSIVGETLDNANLTENCVKFINLNEIIDEYLFYFLRSSKGQEEIRKGVVGSSQPKLPIYNIENIKIKFPSIENQKKIVKILSDLDKKIELNNQINDNLYELCNKIYHNYLDKYSNLIVYRKIVDIAKKVVTGKTPSTKNEEFWNGSIPFITIPDMHNQVFTISTERNITESGAKAIIPKNSISVSCIATVGLVSISTEKSQTNQQINSIIIDNDYDLYYLFEFLSEQGDYMKNIAGGSTTYNINKNTFENIEVPYLPKEILIDFHNIVVNMFEKIKFNQKENITLQDLRDTLLPKLMNGKIDLDKIKI